MTDPMRTYVEPGQLLATIDHERFGATRVVRSDLTVELAQALLARYTETRRQLSDKHVAWLVRHIEHPDPEGAIFEEISVAPDGTPFTGQHLLTAVVRSGRTVENVEVILNRRIDRFKPFGGRVD